MLILYAVLLCGLVFGFSRLPGGFLPVDDQGFITVDVQTPSDSSYARTLGARLMAEDTPLAMIENATLGNQRECRSNLGELLRDAGRFALKSPAILVIGEVTRDIVSQPISLSA